LTGKTGLRELGALLQHCTAYISVDTGPLFIAAAMKKPLVALYGPTRPDRTGPYGSAEATIIKAPVSCAGCLKKHCDNWICMKAITPEMVFDEYRKKVK
jgi:heptosyltransferase-1/heptosyltransferase-2